MTHVLLGLQQPVYGAWFPDVEDRGGCFQFGDVSFIGLVGAVDDVFQPGGEQAGVSKAWSAALACCSLAVVVPVSSLLMTDGS